MDSNRKAEEYRDYGGSPLALKVKETYRLMHTTQTVETVKSLHERFVHNELGKRYTVWELIEKLDAVVDDSDPDLDLPQSVHAFQTAEAQF